MCYIGRGDCDPKKNNQRSDKPRELIGELIQAHYFHYLTHTLRIYEKVEREREREGDMEREREPERERERERETERDRERLWEKRERERGEREREERERRDMREVKKGINKSIFKQRSRE